MMLSILVAPSFLRIFHRLPYGHASRRPPRPRPSDRLSKRSLCVTLRVSAQTSVCALTWRSTAEHFLLEQNRHRLHHLVPGRRDRFIAKVLFRRSRVWICRAHSSGIHRALRFSRTRKSIHHLWKCPTGLFDSVLAVPRVRSYSTILRRRHTLTLTPFPAPDSVSQSEVKSTLESRRSTPFPDTTTTSVSVSEMRTLRGIWRRSPPGGVSFSLIVVTVIGNRAHDDPGRLFDNSDVLAHVGAEERSTTLPQRDDSHGPHWLGRYVKLSSPFAREPLLTSTRRFAGFAANYFSGQYAFSGRSDISSAIGSFAVGFLGNMYGRVTKESPFVRHRLSMCLSFYEQTLTWVLTGLTHRWSWFPVSSCSFHPVSRTEVCLLSPTRATTARHTRLVSRRPKVSFRLRSVSPSVSSCRQREFLIFTLEEV